MISKRYFKKSLALIICLSIFLVLFNPVKTVNAYGEQDHRKILVQVLFGNSYSGNKTNDKKIMAINYATQLCIDLYKKKEIDTTLKNLRDISKKGIPSKLDNIVYKANGWDHRLYTHLGWNFDYMKEAKHNTLKLGLDQKKVEASNFSVRKKILLQTINNIFKFNTFSGFWIIPYDEKCEYFSALVYYIHILGDFEAVYKAASEEANNNKPTLVGLLPLASDDKSGLIDELIYFSEKLFMNGESRSNNRSFSSFKNELESIREEAMSCPYHDWKSYRRDGTDIAYIECGHKVLECMTKYFPNLIHNEKFFAKVFPD